MRRTIPLREVGQFFGVDPKTISSIHLDANKLHVQFELSMFVHDESGQEVKDRRGQRVKDTIRIAVVD